MTVPRWFTQLMNSKVDVGDTITWVPTSKGHNVQFITVPEGAEKNQE